jgi:hypothetical protein
MKTTDDEIKEQIILNISDDAFTILHSDSMDILDVYLVLSAALDYIEEDAERVSKNGGGLREGQYLQ